MNAQRSLFDLEPQPAARKRRPGTRPNPLAELRSQLAAAAADLADAEWNRDAVDDHLDQSRRGGVDDNWIQGGVQLGAVQIEWLTDRVDGRYPVKQTRWLRHLRRVLHLEVHNLRGTVADLAQKVEALAALDTTTTGALPLTERK